MIPDIIINGRWTCIRIGDTYDHIKLGRGHIVHIFDAPAKFPIKMHFPEAKVFAFFNIKGFQFDQQKSPLIRFPLYNEAYNATRHKKVHKETDHRAYPCRSYFERYGSYL